MMKTVAIAYLKYRDERLTESRKGSVDEVLLP